MPDWQGSVGEWNQIISDLPGAHLMQTWEWAEVKIRTGWRMLPQVWRDNAGRVEAAAMVLEKPLRTGGFSAKMSILYIPRGPMMNWSDPVLRQRVLDDLQELAKRKGGIFLKIDAEVLLGRGEPGTSEASEDLDGQAVQTELKQRKWVFSEDQIQFRNTVWIDLSGSPEDWLARMKQKTRYNIRLAEKKGVTIREGREIDLPDLYEMYAKTSVRDGFVIRPREYYLSIWRTFMQAGMAAPLIAEVEGEAIAGMALFWFGGKAWYLHGMSLEKHREKMPNHLIQWTAMRLAREKGALIYDLWGAPDVFSEDDRMWGVYRFKQGLGGEVMRTLGAWDFIARPLAYSVYTRMVPKVLEIMRRRGMSKTRQEVNSTD